jgi:hypothetical protein
VTSTHLGHESLPNLEAWDELNSIVARWICQERGRKEAAPNNHIEVPAVDARPCDWCFDEAVDIVGGGFRELLQIFGSRAYGYGLEGVPEREAARRALQAVIEQFCPNIKGDDLDTLDSGFANC